MSEISITKTGDNPAQNNTKQNGGPPIVFMQESALFGNRKPDRNEWLKHSEIYGALSNIIDASHITGLQRVNGMWRIYTDNIEDKVSLLNEGVSLRGRRVNLLNTNPNRLDSEQTIRIRIKNIPLSVDDGSLTRPLILKGIDVIKSMREKLRYNGKLTNCETGDRLVTVKATTLQTPLPRTMMFGKFIGRVIHIGQNNESKVVKCRKCLEDGHIASECKNEWKCLTCLKTGHRKGECDLSKEADDNNNTNKGSSVESTDGKTEETIPFKAADDVTSDSEKIPKRSRSVKKPKRKENGKQSKKDSKAKENQTLMDTFCSKGNQTPNNSKPKSAKNRTPPSPDEQNMCDKKTRIDQESTDSSDSSSNED